MGLLVSLFFTDLVVFGMLEQAVAVSHVGPLSFTVSPAGSWSLRSIAIVFVVHLLFAAAGNGVSVKRPISLLGLTSPRSSYSPEGSGVVVHSPGRMSGHYHIVKPKRAPHDWSHARVLAFRAIRAVVEGV